MGYLNLIGSRVGIEFKAYPGISKWSESIKLIKENKIMFLPTIAQNDDRDKFLDFTEVYSDYKYVIVTHKNSEFIGSIKDLAEKRVAVAENYNVTALLEKKHINMKFVYKSGIEGCLLAISTGNADATVTTIPIVSHYLNYNGFHNLKIAASTSLPNIEIRMGVRKDNQDFVNILQKGINTISHQEKYQIFNTWVHDIQFDHGVDMVKVWTIGSLSIGITFLIFSIFFYYNRKMKNEIALRTEIQVALNKSFDEVTKQKLITENKNEEVQASIIYAQRLQKAILPTMTQISDSLKESFVLFLPKDIVSGDFYYMETKDNNKVFFTSADCTGHGVPGAMVSLICSNALHQAVIEDNLNKPSDILDSAKKNLELRFARSGEDIKDGMDISFCVLDIKEQKLMYAGAYNPLWIVRHNKHIMKSKKFIEKYVGIKPQLLESKEYHLIEVRADRQPVGKYDFYTPFVNHEIDLLRGDSIYLSTDGYADQFGGVKGKKMKSRNFKRLLLTIQNESMEKQQLILNEIFINWKKKFDQIDDVCVFGVKV